MMTSSPGLRPAAMSASRMATEPLTEATAWLAPQ